LLMLCFGALIGSTWTVQVLDRQYRRLAVRQKELNKSRRTLQETTLPLALRLVRQPDSPFLGDYEDGTHAMKLDGPSLAELELRANAPFGQKMIARDISRFGLALPTS